jgi:hypothetical protein
MGLKLLLGCAANWDKVPVKVFDTMHWRPDAVKAWAPSMISGIGGASGVFTVLETPDSCSLGLVCYTAVSSLPLYFFVAARTSRPTN